MDASRGVTYPAATDDHTDGPCHEPGHRFQIAQKSNAEDTVATHGIRPGPVQFREVAPPPRPTPGQLPGGENDHICTVAPANSAQRTIHSHLHSQQVGDQMRI